MELVFKHDDDCKCGGQEIEHLRGPVVGATEQLEFQIKMEGWTDGPYCTETPYLYRGDIVNIPWHRIVRAV